MIPFDSRKACSNPIAMASSLLAMASSLIAMASNLIAIALKPNSTGLQPNNLIQYVVGNEEILILISCVK